MRDDILGGLKNAMERGASIEQAIKSFLNAGYHEQEVREVAALLQPGILSAIATAPATISVPRAQPSPSQPRIPQKPMPVQSQSSIGFELKRPPRRIDWLVVVLSIILLGSIVAFAVSLLFKEEIAQFLSTLL